MKVCFLLGVFAFLTVSADAYAGKLDRARKESGYSSNSNSSRSSDDDDDDDDDDSCSLLTILFGWCTDEESQTYEPSPPPRRPRYHRKTPDFASDHFYLAYPYAKGSPGTLRRRPPVASDWTCLDESCYAFVGDDPEQPEKTQTLQSGRVQFMGDFGRDSDGLYRTTLGLSGYATSQLGFDTRWTNWLELEGDSTDSLWIGDANLLVRFVALPAFQWSAGAGFRLLTDGAGESFGFNSTTVAELYPVRPLVLRAEVDAGNLGPALFLQGQGSLGVIVKHGELYAGYEHQQLGSVDFRSWFTGVRIHW